MSWSDFCNPFLSNSKLLLSSRNSKAFSGADQSSHPASAVVSTPRCLRKRIKFSVTLRKTIMSQAFSFFLNGNQNY